MSRSKRNLWIPVGVLGVTVAAGAAFMVLRNSGAGVTATDGGIAAGRDLSVGGDVVVNQYDQDERRKRETNRFVASFNRDCRQFLEETAARQITDEPSGMIPNLIGYSYTLMPDLPELVGIETYNTLVAQQAQLGELSGSLFELQLGRRTAAMLAAIPGRQQSATPVGGEADFDTRKQELVTRAQEHCAFLRSLER